MGGLNTYQHRAGLTAIYPPEVAVTYLALGLASEAGEVAGKVKKALRDDGGVLKDPEALAYELGDVLWYVAVLAQELGVSLQDIATKNVEKLYNRAVRGKLGGSGDSR